MKVFLNSIWMEAQLPPLTFWRHLFGMEFCFVGRKKKIAESCQVNLNHGSSFATRTHGMTTGSRQRKEARCCLVRSQRRLISFSIERREILSHLNIYVFWTRFDVLKNLAVCLFFLTLTNTAHYDGRHFYYSNKCGDSSCISPRDWPACIQRPRECKCEKWDTAGPLD